MRFLPAIKVTNPANINENMIPGPAKLPMTSPAST